MAIPWNLIWTGKSLCLVSRMKTNSVHSKAFMSLTLSQVRSCSTGDSWTIATRYMIIRLLPCAVTVWIRRSATWIRTLSWTRTRWWWFLKIRLTSMMRDVSFGKPSTVRSLVRGTSWIRISWMCIRTLLVGWTISAIPITRCICATISVIQPTITIPSSVSLGSRQTLFAHGVRSICWKA